MRRRPRGKAARPSRLGGGYEARPAGRIDRRVVLHLVETMLSPRPLPAETAKANILDSCSGRYLQSFTSVWLCLTGAMQGSASESCLSSRALNGFLLHCRCNLGKSAER